jgi:uncharacterized membrane protein YoaK (UPF0700 family)
VRPPVPRLLLALTLVTGMVDAISFLGCGRIFVANMTGNVVFVGFALAGAAGISAAAALLALGAFLCGSLLGSRILRALGEPRERWLQAAVSIEALLVAGAAVAALGLSPGPASGRRLVVIALLALGMGVRNAIVRALAVPDLTTTVLTMTLTGFAAESPAAGGSGAGSARRAAAVAAMLAGALCGGLLVLGHELDIALCAALAVLVAIAVAQRRSSSNRAALWRSEACSS